ncbi:hypothetical protein ACFP7A_01315 [Sporolactobacillus kofuensis]|uniref:HNH endonuclease n=1 Tax=Sporolactobacillus kofuensis TaxID=269672 RepID=A0ABW1WDP7_9BACL|nr:hypothetical protein [Sporolactobacillus kofuensis]MCO7177036.1 hypothetical protein [Sporolactobacillus kofuensis]
MPKPFHVRGKLVDGELLKQMEQNHLNQSNVSNRVIVQHWTLEEAVSTPKGEGRRTNKRPFERHLSKANGEVKTYFMDLDECHKKYGPPGKVMYPERLRQKEWIQ